MTRRKMKLAYISNESARKASLKKRRMGLLKKVNELSILCDLSACLIIYSPDETEPQVWPSHEVARVLIEKYYALPDAERNKKSMTQETYLKDRVQKLQDQVKKIKKRNQETEMEHLIYSIHKGRLLADLTPHEAHSLITYSRERILQLQRRTEIIQQVSLRDPPPAPFVPTGEGTSATAEVVGFRSEGEASMAAAPPVPQWVAAGGEGNISGMSNYPMMAPQYQYLMDQWFFSGSKPCQPPIPTVQTIGHQQGGARLTSYHHENPNYAMGLQTHQYGSFLGVQVSSSGSNPNMEMEIMPHHQSHGSFHGPYGLPFQQQSHHGSMTMNPTHGIQTGYGFQPQGSYGSGGGGSHHQSMLGNQFEFYTPSYMSGGFGVVPQGGGEETGYQQRCIDKGKQPIDSKPRSNWMGTNFQLQPHYRGGDTNIYDGGEGESMAAGQPWKPAFGWFGGASTVGGQFGGASTGGGPFGGVITSGGGGDGSVTDVGEQIDSARLIGPDNSKGKAPADY